MSSYPQYRFLLRFLSIILTFHLVSILALAGIGSNSRFHQLSLVNAAFPFQPITLSFTVNSLLDTADNVLDGVCDDGAGHCTLRAALQEANNNISPDTINFSVTGTISLANALPNITDDVTITGPSATLLTIQRSTINGTPAFRIFTVISGTSNISGLTISNGRTPDDTVASSENGGGILNSGSLNLMSVSVSGNQTGDGKVFGTSAGFGGFGGGICNDGTMTITNSTISGNKTGAGDTDNWGGFGGLGGGIQNNGTLTIANVTISGNQTGPGSTNNNALGGFGGSGGGISNAGTLTIIGSTISNNKTGNGFDPAFAGTGGGLYRELGTATIRSSIIAGNSVPSGARGTDIFGDVNSEGYNLIQNTSDANINETQNVGTNVTLVDPKLGPLADNGGPTATHLPALDSVVIDKGKSFGSTTDQRGFTRTINLSDTFFPNSTGGDGSDIGAVEVNYQVSATAGTPQSAGINTAFSTNLQATVTESGIGRSGIAVTFTAPVSGPSGTFSGSSIVITNSNGIATAPVFTANSSLGSYNVTASIASRLPSALFSLTNIKADQTISFGTPPNKTFGNPDFNISATASSGLAVSFVAAGQCTINGSTVHLLGAGSCTITASQAGDSSYNAAPPVSQSFTIGQAAPTITVTSSVNPSNLGQNVIFTATVASAAATPTGNVQLVINGVIAAPTQTLNSSGVATFSTSFTTAGEYTITVNYSGDINFTAGGGSLTGGQVVNTSISINDVSLSEGNGGTKNFDFTVTLEQPSNLTVSVDFVVDAGTATAGTDYQSTNGTLTFIPGETQKSITVEVNGDTQNEQNETFFVNLINPVNAIIIDNQASGTIVNDDSPFVQFSASSYSFNEGAGHGDIIVTRIADTSSSMSVDYQTSDQSGTTPCQTNNTGFASDRCDYATTTGTLNFAAGETQKTIPLILINDAYVEGPEQLTIKLRSAQGAALGATSTATITITDDDTQTATQNPIDNLDFFIRQLYIDFLGREPEAAGFQFWRQRMTAPCPQGDQCDRTDTALRFFSSDEFKERGYFVYLFYHAALRRRPTYSEWIMDVSKLNGFKTVSEQEAARALFIQDFVSRQEFMNLYDSFQTGQSFVDALIQKSGVMPASRQQLIDNYPAVGRAKTLRAFLETPEVQAAFLDRAFVTMLYFGFLRRDAEPGGFNFWMDKLNSTNHDYRFLIGGFLRADEYRFRFAFIPLAP